MKIHLLAPEVVDQIAAGEVVERPAHLLKELIENSLDAGADRIEVEMDEGGRSLVVIDNGQGIAKDDLSFALARHATSKIQKTSDLWSLSSYGFRGEALASIASVSELSLSSREKGKQEAYRVISQFGKLSAVETSGGVEGTRVQIRELFTNVPARLKFLKSEAAEISQLKNVLKALAMVNPKVEFRVKHKNQLLFLWSKTSSLKERAEQILGKGKLYEGEVEIGSYKAQVVLASPKEVARNSRQIWIFVQNRWVQDRSLQAAIMEGYRNLLMHGEFPIAALFLTCDPEDIDVNIHPTKSQVKFREANKAFKITVDAVRKVLSEGPWVPTSNASSLGFSHRAPQENLSFSPREFSQVQYSKKSFPLSANPLKEEWRAYAPSQTSTAPPSPVPEEQQESSSQGTALDQYLEAKTPGRSWSQLHLLGQAHLTYILAQNDQSLFLIDQHAAHERVAFESLMQAWKGSQIDVQNYLVPLVLDFEAAQAEALLSVAEELKKLGVYIESMGPESVAVSSAPSLLSEKALSKALDSVGKEVFEQGGSFAMERMIGDLCATMACHSVIRAGQSLSHEEMASLLQQMDEYPFSSFCPHGRPVWVEYPFHKIEREFGRIP